MVDYKNLYHLGFWLPATNRYESDFSNEVLYMPVDQEAAKLSKVKIGGQKICQFSQAKPCQCTTVFRGMIKIFSRFIIQKLTDINNFLILILIQEMRMKKICNSV